MDSDGSDGLEPVYVVELPPNADGAVLAPPQPTVAPRSSRRRWWWAAGGLLVVATAVLGVAVANRSDTSSLGELTARLAAQRFVAAINAGDKDAAAAEACPSFADEARSVAESGRDRGIDFVLGAVRTSGPEAGTVVVTQRLHFAGSVQSVAHTVHLDRTNGRWVVCGQS